MNPTQILSDEHRNELIEIAKTCFNMTGKHFRFVYEKSLEKQMKNPRKYICTIWLNEDLFDCGFLIPDSLYNYTKLTEENNFFVDCWDYYRFVLYDTIPDQL
jgi:hypothetical protein